jgi:hypothetical protein
MHDANGGIWIMADDGFPVASSTRSRRGRSAVAGAAKAPVASIDDFLGGGGAALSSAPVASAMPEAGGYVTDRSGVEKYDDVPRRHAVPQGPLHKEDHTLRREAEERERFPRNTDGRINNCSLANSDDEKDCQICNGTCPDRARYRKHEQLPIVAPPQQRPEATTAKPMRPGELDAALLAPRKSNAPELHPAYGRIIRTTFAFDPDKVFDELNDKLRFVKPIRDMGYIELAEALDEAARLHRDASRLHAHAKVTLGTFEADCETMGGDMRAQAISQLKAEKEEKGGKQITDGDVTSRTALLFPDEYRRQARLKIEAKSTVGHLETLIKVWELRRREIDTMLRECRKGS